MPIDLQAEKRQFIGRAAAQLPGPPTRSRLATPSGLAGGRGRTTGL